MTRGSLLTRSGKHSNTSMPDGHHHVYESAIVERFRADRRRRVHGPAQAAAVIAAIDIG
jgi:hypothetical protein